MIKKIVCTAFLLACHSLFAQKTPHLIVQLVVDQLRGDLLYTQQEKLTTGGFSYLLNHSVDYRNANHPHANTVTCVGHATIATGAYPSLHGIVANDWFDEKLGHTIYCVEDLENKIIKVLPSQQASPGRSPRNILASTFSDELELSQKGRAFAVSFKDRSAITLAGHAGKAFWFDKEDGGFVSSEYYYSAYPQWVNSWNSRYVPKNKTWTLSIPLNQYHYEKAPRFPNRFPEFGKHFPHHLGEPQNLYYYKYLSMSPFADELTAEFAIQLLEQEKLGQSKDKVDYLAISFSAVDAIGHQFGPNSLESEDNLHRLNKTLAQLLSAIDKHVGLENTLIVLTADHGVSDSSPHLNSHQIPENNMLNTAKVKKMIEDALAQRFDLPPETLQQIDLPYIYLAHPIIHQHQLSVNTVSAYLAEVLQGKSGIFQAYPLPLNKTKLNWLSSKVDKMTFLGRAGDIYIVPPPYQVIKNQDEFRVNHGTPWNYDSYVPLLFVNPGCKNRHLIRPVYTTDIAPTLSALLSIKKPSAAVGQPLGEVIQCFEKQQ